MFTVEDGNGMPEAPVFLLENIKRKYEQMTGRGKPSPHQARAAARDTEPEQFLFADDGSIPNNPMLPFLVYKHAVALTGPHDGAAVFEELFRANGWGDSWRDGIYDYVHYHSSIHEVLGIARGTARVRFGGALGAELALAAGDVAVLPAGTGHQRLEASRDLLVVGAYPPQGRYDECRGSPEEHDRARLSIPKVPLPKKDPVFGADGPMTKLWRS
jgi:uncharacterized protein YjlB